MQHFNIKVKGKVQGVFFRDSTRRKARELGLYGFVRNEPDGSVYIEVQGEEPLLSDFIKWCNQGPPHARVDRLNIEESALKTFHTFEINY